MQPMIGSRFRSLAAAAALAASLGALSACVVARPPEYARTGGMREEQETRRDEWKKEEQQAKASADKKDKLFREIEAQVESATRELRFASGSYKVPRAAHQELKQLGQLLSQEGTEDARIRLEGYTDNKGSSDTNMRLAQQRAQAVRRILLDNGARISQLEVEGRGKENPVASNTTEDGRAQNRRVEMEVSGIPTG